MIEMLSMKKRVISVLFLLVLVACAPGPTAEAPRPTDFRFGNEGLYMEFVLNLPPQNLYSPGEFVAMIHVENRGTSDVGGQLDTIYLSGFDNTIITGISTYGQPITPLEGRGPFVPQGGIGAVGFTGTIQSLSGKRIDKYQPTILATACYNYETVASAQVCIDPNPYAPTSIEKVCLPTPVSLGSQGAPIAVTNVNVVASPGKTRFTIDIQNVGRGDVFRYGLPYLDKCNPYNPGLSFNEVDFVKVTDVSVSGTSILQSCKPIIDSHVRLTNGKASLFCEFSSARQQAPYLTPLNIVMQYGNRLSIVKRIDIRPIS